jgi:hypothetical protein
MWPRIAGLGINNTKDCVNWHAAAWKWSHGVRNALNRATRVVTLELLGNLLIGW